MLIKVYTGSLWIIERQIVPILERLRVSQAKTNFFSGGGMVMLSGAKWDFQVPRTLIWGTHARHFYPQLETLS